MLAAKSNANGKLKYKSRYVISGNKNKLNHYMVDRFTPNWLLHHGYYYLTPQHMNSKYELLMSS